MKRYGDVTAYEITVDDNESGRDDSYMSDEDQAAMLAPNRQSFNLEFEFANSATWEGLGDGDLISISSSLYN